MGNDPKLCVSINVDAHIVHDPHFESGLLKIQEENETFIYLIERQELTVLLIRTMTRNVEDNEEAVSLIVKLAAKKLQASDFAAPEAYLDTQCLLPLSNFCESFFSSPGMQ